MWVSWLLTNSEPVWTDHIPIYVKSLGVCLAHDRGSKCLLSDLQMCSLFTCRLSLLGLTKSEKADTPLPCRHNETRENGGVFFCSSCVLRGKKTIHAHQTNKTRGPVEVLMRAN